MKIACSMIALNEAQYIARAVESIADIADVLVLVDGGSRDKTIDLTAAICRKNNIEFIEATRFWKNDFSESRNKSLSLIPQNVDWWFRLDADETVGMEFSSVFKNILSTVPDETQAIGIKQANLVNANWETGEFSYSAGRGGWESHPRIFRNYRLPDMQSAWRWVGKVHESCQLITRQGLVYPDKIASWNATVIHWGWLSMERRAERETLYEQIAGSGFSKGSLTNRTHTVKKLWEGLL